MKKVAKISDLKRKGIARVIAGDQANFEALAIAVITQGVQEEGSIYLSSPGGQWWLNTLNLEPKTFLEKYLKLNKGTG
jgi:hypothetical protein